MRTPDYWWDFDADTRAVIVQSNRHGGGELARFVFTNDHEAQFAIASADALVADYKAGRKTPIWNKDKQ